MVLAYVSVLGIGKLNIASSMDSEGVIPEGVIWRPPNCTVLAKLEFFAVEHDSFLCAMKEKIEDVKEGPCDIRVVERGVDHDLYFAGSVFYNLIVPSGVGIARCKVALWHP